MGSCGLKASPILQYRTPTARYKPAIWLCVTTLTRCIARRLPHKVLDKAVLSRLGIGLVLLIALGL